MTISTAILGPEALDEIVALCDRALATSLLRAELEGALFAPDQPAVVRGDPGVGIVASVRAGSDGFVRLLAVDPAHRRRGHGTTLLAAAEADLGGTKVITVGADAPYYLFPGVEVTETAMLCLLERRRYQREEANFNMEVDLTRLPDDPGGTAPATGRERDEIAAWMQRHWANWEAEVLRALDHGTLLVARDGAGIAGFCAWDVNRGGLLGPIASRPDLIGRGAGRALLVGALHRIRAAGRDTVEVSWVGPIRPYAAVGGRVTRVFFVYRKRTR